MAIARAFSLILLMFLAACNAKERGSTEITLWHAYRGAEADALQAVVEIYNSANAARGVQVRTLPVPFDAYADKISAAVPRGRGPDLFLFAQDRLGGWAEAGQAVEPIGFLLEERHRSRFLPHMLEAMTYRGQVYGLPINFKSLALIRNTALAPEAPTTSQELAAIARANTQAQRGIYGLAFQYQNFDFQAALLNGFGGGALDERNRAILDRAENARAFELLLRWKDEDPKLPPEPSGALITSLFNSQRAAFVISGPWFFGEVAPEIAAAVSPLPTLDEAGGAPIRPWVFVEGVFIAQGSKNVDEAFAFADFLTGPDAAAVMAAQGRQLPANAEVYQRREIADDPVLAGFRQQLDSAVLIPNAAEMALVWAPGEQASRRILRKEAGPAAALADAQAALERSIADLRRPQP